MRYLLLTTLLSACATTVESPKDSDQTLSNEEGADFTAEDGTESTTDSGEFEDSDEDEDPDTFTEDNGDGSGEVDADVDDGVDEGAPAIPMLSVSGSNSVISSSGSYATPDGCTLSYTRFEPTSGEPIGEAFILHGFMRGQEQFFELASHLASWGVTSTTVDLCHSTFTDVDAVQNSADAVDLAQHLGADRVVWMGQSNGGVSALIAGGMSPDITRGILGLDPVESFAGGGAEWADDVESPSAALFGISDTCNDSNSGFPVYTGASGSTSLRIAEADHCSFEFPTGFLCTAVCERPKTRFTNVQISKTILELSTAWTLGSLDSTFDGSRWWEADGDRYSELIAQGAIAPM